jgi:hypothetical protein
MKSNSSISHPLVILIQIHINGLHRRDTVVNTKKAQDFLTGSIGRGKKPFKAALTVVLTTSVGVLCLVWSCNVDKR